MDNSPETKKAQAPAATTNPVPASTAPASATASKPVETPAAVTTKPASAAAPVAKPAESKPAEQKAPAAAKPASDYKTANIGQWKSKQEDYFAKQNQEQSAKKAKKKATFKRFLPFMIIAGVLIVGGLGTWGVISLINYINRPTLEETASDPSIISGNSTEAVQSYQGYLQQVYNDALAVAMAEEGANIDTSLPSEEAIKKANEALSDAVANTAATEAGEKYRDAMLLSEMMIYYNTWQCDNVFRLEKQINSGDLSLLSQYNYNLALQNCYQANGNAERAKELWAKVVELDGEIYYGETNTLREGVTE